MFKVLVAAALAASISSAAQAAIVIATYTGTVIDGTDGANLFGGGDLAGDAFTTVYTLDTDLAAAHDQPAYAPGQGSLGSGFITNVSLTINHMTQSYAFTFHDEVVYDPYGFADIYYGAFGTASGSFGPSIWNELSYGGFHHFTDFGSGSASQGGGAFNLVAGDLTTSGSFDSDTVRLASAGTVPEPASWALMITGFGLAGSMLRRRATLARAA